MALALELKLDSFPDFDQEWLRQLRDDSYHDVKINTNKKTIKFDAKDARFIKSIDNVKLCYERQGGGIVGFVGNLQCDFRPPFGGMFFVKKVFEEETDFKSLKGVLTRTKFVYSGYSPMTIDQTREALNYLANSNEFEYNIGQFDEFMEIFNFYKKLSDELNNNITYPVVSKTESYFFVPADVKEFDSDFKQEVKDQNGVIKGYKFDVTQYDTLSNDIKDKVRELIDVHIEGGMEVLARIKRCGDDNIYLSNYNFVTEAAAKNLKQFLLVNIRIIKGEVILSGEMKSSADYEEDYSYLNLYDMGQKIKIESIDNSLRLINQGATGAASELLEYLIGDTKMPNQASRTSRTKEKYMKGLNESQRKAFLMAIDGSPVSLIKGPPGTGKTHVINAITQYITKEFGEKVIISSQTHIAIDNVLDKLMENNDLIIPNRITNRRNKYSKEYIDETLYKTWGRKFLAHNERSTNKKLKEKMAIAMANFNGEFRFRYSEEVDSEFSVIGATTTTSAIAGKKGLETLKGYDWLIIDEVSKCPITEVLRYLPYVSRVIMVGDDFQLAPLLEFTKDDVKELPSYDEDMFEKMQAMYEQSVFAKVLSKAEESNRLVLLNENYRSVKQVLTCYNIFYNGELIGRREEVRPEKVHFTNPAFEDKDAVFVEVLGGQETKDGTSRFNVQEINATVAILKDLMKTAINPEKMSVAAIFPYAAQISHFQKNNIALINKAKKLFKSFDIDTVDAFQGKECDVVLVNTVVTDATQRNFLNDFRRINVSMSRSRDKLIVFGNKITLSKINMKISGGMDRHYFKDIIEYISSAGKMIRYKEGEIDYGNQSKSGSKLA